MIPNETPLWIVTCNFKSFEIHDMNKPNEPAIIVLLEDVRNKLHILYGAVNIPPELHDIHCCRAEKAWY